ncbi:tyrosine-type recombinase/integrase, partial [Acidomonas methanolica]|uniref:tyrosine-type recombinase/integrase n=1 Tax=Acidomonas methanolica TaxID=437 RepID=UPI00351CF095|nr:hypothetical protein [Acidomonas methanolica]
GNKHVVPLSGAAIAILEAARALRDPNHGDLVFPGHKLGKPLSDVALSKALKRAADDQTATVHGLRSTFSDWLGEETHIADEIGENALSHGIKDKGKAAYKRGTMVEKRRDVMETWADWCIPGTPEAQAAEAAEAAEAA